MRKFYQQLDASRSDAYTPYGSSTWKKTPTFDQARYDTDMANWQAQYGSLPTGPTWVPGPTGEDGGGGGMAQIGPDGNIIPGGRQDGSSGMGYWKPAAERPAAPNRASYTSFDYDNTVAFNPEMQGKWDTIQQKMQQLLEGYDPNAKVDLIENAGGQYSDQLADAIFRRTTRLAGPELEKSQRALETRLAERGFQVGNEGYNTEMSRFEQGKGDLYADAADRAQITAAQQALQEAGFTNSSRLAEFQGNNNYRAQLAQLLSGLEGQMGAGLAGTPTSFSAPNLPGIDVLGAYNNKYMGELDAYNADTASDNALMGTLASLAIGFGTGGAGLAAGLGTGASAGLTSAASLAGMGTGGFGVKAPSAKGWWN